LAPRLNECRAYVSITTPLSLRFRHISVAVALTVAWSLYGGSVRAQEPSAAPRAPFILDSVAITLADVYDTAGPLDILNQFHTLTSPSVVEDEIFFEIGDTVTANDLAELERNLRALEIFSRIYFDVIARDGDEERTVPRATLRIRTKDSWSLRTGGTFSSAGNDITLLGTLREVNLGGLGLQLGGSLEYSTVNDRGWRIGSFIYEPNLAASHVNVLASGGYSSIEKSVRLSVERPFFSERVRTGYAAGVSHFVGDEYFYRPEGELVLRHTSRTRTSDASGWYSHARGARGSRFFASGSLTVDRTIRDSVLPFAPRAFENSIGAFLGVESIKRTYERIEDADFTGDRLIPIGGMGSVSIGKISPHSGGLDNVVYVGGDARQSIRTGPLHLFASIAAGTGLAGKTARFTMQRFTGTGHLQLPYGALAARLDQSTVWNWPRYVALALDNPSGLRGYSLSGLVGDNRVIANIEYRVFPVATVWLFDLGATAFYDVGSVWSQGTSIVQSRFHSSVGAGIRISSANGTFNRALLRVDLAYNFDEGRISRLIISTHEAFDAFGTLEYRPPGPYLP
jgi:hypothetical protein